MKILFITSSFRPQRGGVETHTWEVVQRLIEKGHDVIIITEKLPLHPSPQSRSEVKGFQKTYRLHFGDLGFFKKFRIWFEIFKHRQLIERADIVHCHDVCLLYHLPMFEYLKPYSKLLEKPKITKVQSICFLKSLYLASRLWAGMKRKFFCNNNHIVSFLDQPLYNLPRMRLHATS